MANDFINIKCSACGHMLKVKNPGKPGTYQVVCPQCKHQIKLQLNAKPIQLETGQKSEPHENKVRVPLLTDITPEKNGKGYVVKPMVKTNLPYAFRCPTCGKPVLVRLPKPGVQGAKCGKCGTQFFLKASEGQQPQTEKQEKEQEQKKPKSVKTQRTRPGCRYPGVLTWGNIFSRKKFVLKEGTYVLGRKDEDAHSDIEFNDAMMSRRSVVIDVKHKENGYFFKLTVKRSANPVLHNNKPMAETESVYLKYGDSIQMGHTVINFKQFDK